jgi:FixJ family two-component response regulator
LLGYTTVSFATAEDFLKSGRVSDTACLIVDMHLPGMSGAELQSRLILDGYRMPVIFITAFVEEATRERVLRNGALGYLSKPLQEQSLIACLGQVQASPGRSHLRNIIAASPQTASSIPAYRVTILSYGTAPRAYYGPDDSAVLTSLRGQTSNLVF